MSLSSLANDPELQKFVAAKELENQLTAQVKYFFLFEIKSKFIRLFRFII